MRVAYLSSRYPAVSHTFIQREVAALRATGTEVDTFSIRRPDAGEILSAEDRREHERTTNLLPARPDQAVRSHVQALRRAPRAYLSALGRALRMRPPGLRGFVWQCFYFAEAMLLGEELHARGIRHVHVHFANVSADVALIACHYGRRSGTGPQTWSFTMHGPTEFADVEAHRLRHKAEDAVFVACISDFARSQLMALLAPTDWDKLEIVHCGVDPAAFAPQAA